MDWRLTVISKLLKVSESGMLNQKKAKHGSALYLIITSFPSATRANVNVLVNPLICLTQSLRLHSVLPLCTVYVMQ